MDLDSGADAHETEDGVAIDRVAALGQFVVHILQVLIDYQHILMTGSANIRCLLYELIRRDSGQLMFLLLRLALQFSIRVPDVEDVQPTLRQGLVKVGNGLESKFLGHLRHTSF